MAPSFFSILQRTHRSVFARLCLLFLGFSHLFWLGLLFAAESPSLTQKTKNLLSPLSPLAGHHVTSDQFEQTPYWAIVFLSSRCPCSQAHQERLAELARFFSSSERPRRIGFIGINANQDEPLAEARTYFENQQLPFPVYRDAGMKWLELFPALKTPHVFIIDREKSEILYQGGVDDSSHPKTSSTFYLRDAFDDIEAGRNIRAPKTRALGCQISRKNPR
jgi:hypothetical protein